MGNKDLHQSDFYENQGRFSDAFNGILFGGQEVMKPEELEEADSVMVSILENGAGEKVICDKVRKWRGQYVSLMILENQSYVDYRMVLRAMRTELMGYEKQQKRTYEEGKNKGIKLDKDEFLSRMKREQKYIPIITLILYMGERPWDGSRSLHELLELDERLKPFVSNYKLNLYDYHEYQDFSVFKTENRALFEALSCANDEARMEETMKKHPEWYSRLDEESARAILGITGVKIDLARIREVTEEGEEVFSMCKAFDDHKERGRLEGIQEGMARGMKEGKSKVAISMAQKSLSRNIPEEVIILDLEEELELSYEEAKKLFQKEVACLV